MNFFRKTIFTGMMPNMRSSDVSLSLSLLLFPWRWTSWRNGEAGEEVERWLSELLHVPYVKTFNSGRTALFYALKALGVGENDGERQGRGEVVVEAYTCMVVINAIRWLGATPVYVDIGKDLNMDPVDFEKKITKNTQAIIIQHTFGQPADLSAILSIAKKHNIPTVEDCAHALGATYQGKPVGAHADVSMFSFGSDKVVSCVRGGAVATNNPVLVEKLEMYHSRLPIPGRFFIFQSLLQYSMFSIGKAFYHAGIGKVILWMVKALGLTPRIISKAEKAGKQDMAYPARLPNALAILLSHQLNALVDMNAHRKEIAAYYNRYLPKKIERQTTTDDSIFLRYTLFVEYPNHLRRKLKKRGVLLGDWYDTPIAPRGIDISVTGYQAGFCPHAEMYAKRSVNLPTHILIDKKKAEYIVKNLIAELTE